MGHGDRWGSGTSSGPSLAESNITEPIFFGRSCTFIEQS